MMDGKIRLGIIGIGNMGSAHAKHVAEGQCPDFELAAVADVNPSRLQWAGENLPGTVLRYDSAEALLDSGRIDACMICVPHYDHPKYAIDCLRRGIHVMVEKPAGVYTRQVREMNEEAAKHPTVIFGMMFNQRTNCVYRKVRELVQSGDYGNIRRTNWIITNWYRPQAYYDSGDWRATWSGEGGGVLLNQCPHQLDLWQWICGMPVSVKAKLSYGLWHDIEVEDDVTAYVRYANGATGVFISSTGDLPGTNRLEIVGTRGKIVIEGGTLKHWTLPESERDICAQSSESFPHVETAYAELTPEKGGAHADILQNFTDAIRHGEALISPGCDGLAQLTLINAAYLSAWRGSARIKLPFDTALYDRLLAARVAHSVYRGENAVSKPSEAQADRWQVNW